MADESHPTRAALLDAGLRLAESASLAATTVDHVVRAAGVSKGTFYVHFADRTAFLAALHETFYVAINERIAKAMAPHPPGAQRLRSGAEAYMDACVQSRGVKAMLVDVRSEPAIAARIRANADAYAATAATDFAALGAPQATAAARLFVAMVNEVALAELEAAEPQPELREALWHLARAEE
jgi:AcrR family transcriptional regulator